MNYLHLGDCLEVLRHEISDSSVDLIYIDPPFNSKRNYNIFFDDKDIQTQRVAFEDTWSLKNIQDSLSELQSLKTEKIHRLLTAYSEVAPFAFPYLVMMSLRILELHRVLKPTGSFYLHCDPNMSHYLKTVCDLIFGAENFLNEIIWCYRERGISKTCYNKKHDVILFYCKKRGLHIFNYAQITEEYSEVTVKKFKYTDENGRKFRIRGRNVPQAGEWRRKTDIPIECESEYSYRQYLDESDGSLARDWIEMPFLNQAAKERLGYPTQKPKALLERIIKASSNQGDTVLDAFCGCGTTLDAAEGLGRKWTGIDISPVAVSLIKRRLADTYGKVLSKYEVRGTPKDEPSAIRLWEQNPFAFQDWWITELGAFSATYGRKGSDKGLDGIAKYLIGTDRETVKAAFQVKGGKVQSKDVDALLGAMNKHKCELGVFLIIKPPTGPMLETVGVSGFLKTHGFNYPKLQILTLSEYFSGKQLKLPQTNITFESAPFKGKGMNQLELI